MPFDDGPKHSQLTRAGDLQIKPRQAALPDKRHWLKVVLVAVSTVLGVAGGLQLSGTATDLAAFAEVDAYIERGSFF
jgi:hypothetical protein